MAFTTPNMALRAWDQVTDPYNHTQLADNFSKLDLHDHSTGKGVQIPTSGLLDGAVTAAKLAAGAVPDFTIGDGAITTAKLANNSVTVDKMTPNSIPTAKVTMTGMNYVMNAGGNENTFFTIPFNTEEYDTHDAHNVVTNNSRLVAPVTGVYVISVHVNLYLYDPINGRTMIITKNGGSNVAQQSWGGMFHGTNSQVQPHYTLAAQAKLTAGDYIEVKMAARYGEKFEIRNLPFDPGTPPTFAFTLVAKS